MIVIIDGLGNIGSVKNIIKKIGHECVVSSDYLEISRASKIILPGVGSFDQGMKNLSEKNLINILNEQVLINQIPILGICLGMQLMLSESDEGNLEGLSWVDGVSKKFSDQELAVPHMGWNTVSIEKDSSIFFNFESVKRFYFVHSYYVSLYNKNDVLTTTQYGNKFVSSFEKKNIIGVQFHPEKSHLYGMKLLQNFIENF